MRTASRRVFVRRLFVLLVGALAVDGCGGGTEPSGSDLFMRFRANGTLTEYSLPAGLLTAVNNTTGQSNAATSGNDGGATFMTLQVFDVAPIQLGTYAGFTITTGAVGAIIGYRNALGIDFVSGTAAPEATIVITELGATRVGGTFFGVLHESGQPDVSLTEGQFLTARVN